MHVQEPITLLLPPALDDESEEPGSLAAVVRDLGLVYLHILLPADFATRLPSVSEGWSDFGSGDDEDAKASVRGLLQSLGWQEIMDLGDISTARGPCRAASGAVVSLSGQLPGR